MNDYNRVRGPIQLSKSAERRNAPGNNRTRTSLPGNRHSRHSTGCLNEPLELSFENILANAR